MDSSTPKSEPKHATPRVLRFIRPFVGNPSHFIMMLARVTQGDNRIIKETGFDSEGAQPTVFQRDAEDDNFRYVSEEDADAFCRRLIDRGHLGALEHVQATFHIVCSLACSHQMVRHRMASYLQCSYRHVEPDTFVRNIHDRETTAVDAALDRVERAALVEYHSLLAAGTPKELARMVMPVSTATNIVVTANLRAWRHFLILRNDKTAQYEIRMLAGVIAARLVGWFPAITHNLPTPEKEGE